MSDTWQDRLSEYLDGELSAPEVTQLELHLQECTVCRRSLAELRTVVARLGSDPLTRADQPSPSEWDAIRRALQPLPRRWIIPTAIAASLVGLAFLGGMVVRRGDPGAGRDLTTFPAYYQASMDLEITLRENQDRLRPGTVRALEASLAAIDRALAEAEQALAADPANDYVIRSVSQLRTARLTILQRAITVLHLRS